MDVNSAGILENNNTQFSNMDCGAVHGLKRRRTEDVWSEAPPDVAPLYSKSYKGL